jgi:hypothetical protein
MRKIFLIGLVCLTCASISFMGYFGSGEIVSASEAAELSYAPHVSNELGIIITATLQKISKDAKTWDVVVVMETRTHALGSDMENSAVLIADGNQYKPSGWEGSPPGGHYRKGVLHFNAITPEPASVELQIRMIGDPTARSFKWRLK